MDYEKKYKEALERARQFSEKSYLEDSKGIVDYIFPELKESGDIRKRIIDALHGDVLEMSEIKDATTWLEKQGNLMKALQISNARIGELIEKNYYLKEQLEKQGELKKHDVCDNCEQQGSCVSPCPMKLVEKQGEQNPVIKMKTPEESLSIDSDTYNKIVDECIYGEQKPIKEHNACEFCEDRYGCVSPCSMKLIEEEKPADEIKQKFHEGDWVVYCNDDVDLITGIEENGYCINNGGYIPFICENEMRLWDITDAKVGDVLVSESTCGLGTWYCIFKSLDGDESMTVYCYLARDGRFETKKELCFDKDPYNTKPATKEQRETLMKAMADAGYEWDAEKKELKNIKEEYNGEDYGIDGLYAAIDILQKTLGEVDGYQSDDGILAHKCAISAVKELSKQKPAWGEEDIELLDNTIKFIEDRVAATSPSLRTYSPTLTGKEIPFLKALKDRVQPKQEWSEEDNRMCKAIIDNIQAICEEGYFVGNIDSGELIEWLKSLKDRYVWKPSDEQMDALRYVTNFDYGGYKATLVSLYEQLKKLRGE